MRIVLAANSEYLPGLALTLASALVFWRGPKLPRCSVLTTTISAADRAALRTMAARLRPGSEVSFHDIGGDDLAGLPPAPGLHPMAYARLLIPKLFPGEKVLYLDADLLILCDLHELFVMDLGGKAAVAPRSGRMKGDCPWLEEGGIDPEADYFCSGVMVIDTELWRELNIAARTLELVLRDPAACKNWDQTALNYTLYQNVVILPDAWSRFQVEFARRAQEDVFIMHYITAGKPWNAPSDAGAQGLWLTAFRMLCAEEFPQVAAKLALLAKRRGVEHLAARAGLGALTLAGSKQATLDQWRWKVKASAPPAARPETARCRELEGRIKEALCRR